MYTNINGHTEAIMFNMNEIGRTIARLRKAADMTQMELADHMGISFQAVSNWERGQTMPDISKLGELSAILHASIDEILGNEKGSEVVRKIQRDEDELEHLERQELRTVAPLLKPRQVERAMEPMRDMLVADDVITLAPYVSPETVDGWAKETLKDGGPVGNIAPLAPFLSDAMLLELTQPYLDGDSLAPIQSLLPFIPPNALDDWAQRAYERTGTIDALPQVAPFLSQASLDAIVTTHIRAHGYASILPLAPFVSTALLDECARSVYADKGVQGLQALAPFISNALLEEIAGREAAQNGVAGIQNLLPFMRSERVDELAREAMRAHGLGSITQMAPFMDQRERDEAAREAFEKDGMVGLQTMLPHLSKGMLDELAQGAYAAEGVRGLQTLAPFLKKDTLNRLAETIVREQGFAALMPLLNFLNLDDLSVEIRRKEPEEE